MLNIKKKEIIYLFDNFFKKYGFVNNGNIWYKENDETVQVYELIKSSYSHAYSINIGINVKKLKLFTLSNSTFCLHLHRDSICLIDDIEKRKYLIELLNFENKEENEIKENIAKYIEYLEDTKTMTLLEELSNHNGILNYLSRKLHHKYLWTKYVKEEDFFKYLK